MANNGYISLEAAAALMAIDGKGPCMKAVLDWVIKGTSGLKGFGPAAIAKAGVKGMPPVKLQATYLVHRWATRAEWVEQFVREIAERRAAVMTPATSDYAKSHGVVGVGVGVGLGLGVGLGVEFAADAGSQRDARTGLMTVPRPDKVGAYPPSRRRKAEGAVSRG